jgi:hypothetical protein
MDRSARIHCDSLSLTLWFRVVVRTKTPRGRSGAASQLSLSRGTYLPDSKPSLDSTVGRAYTTTTPSILTRALACPDSTAAALPTRLKKYSEAGLTLRWWVIILVFPYLQLHSAQTTNSIAYQLTYN